MLSDLLFRLRAIFRRRSVEEELDEELRFHYAHETERLIASGLDPNEAARQARLAIGGLDQVKEECREARGMATLETFCRDGRYASRGLRHNPALIVVGTLMLG